ncbi:uncharacterized protein Eint_051250 [Encephalitozoon intestinalis ATCC 50506]|uniref:Uncharacterized protein n=1 Tax=Encephalitozoon intestinalis (strain ATCC 50506) TaxID=876142 RepID=E0S6Y6_ENCIT|nr:uncharacterized protein Eint_051250 [Encephalitozoon intestinalis ATCC 50506]ADM11572.1 hypothetical protein Eint_051250 [Encephalitozoon intestinalis ATCC 50506]UTX45289.1 hypothetical protein GPK93_05g08350 [Encephalitozoon intestinalis]
MSEKSRLNLILRCVAYTKEPKILILVNLLEMAWKASALVHSNEFSFFILNNNILENIKGEDTPEFAQEMTEILSKIRNDLEGLEMQVCLWYIDAHKLIEKEIGKASLREFNLYIGQEFKEIFSQLYDISSPFNSDKKAWWAKLLSILDACNSTKTNQNQNITEWTEKFKEEFLASEYVKFVNNNKIVYTGQKFEKKKKAIRRILIEGEDKGHLFDFWILPHCCNLMERLVS